MTISAIDLMGLGCPPQLAKYLADNIVIPPPTPSGAFRQPDVNAVTRDLNTKIAETCISVKDWGAVGNGIADDAPAIQNCFNYVVANFNDATIYFPTGVYRVGTPLILGDTNPVTHIAHSINLRGDGIVGTSINWDAGVIGTLLTINLIKYSALYHIAFQGPGKSSSVNGIRMTGPIVSGGTQTLNLTWNNVVFDGFQVGLIAGDNSLGIAASEMTFEICQFNNCDRGFLGEGSGNSLNFTFRECGFGNCRIGLDGGVAGNIKVYGGNTFQNDEIEFRVTDWSPNCVIEGVRSELAAPCIFASISSQAADIRNNFTASNDDFSGAGPLIQFVDTEHANVINNRFGGTNVVICGPGAGHVNLWGNYCNGLLIPASSLTFPTRGTLDMRYNRYNAPGGDQRPYEWHEVWQGGFRGYHYQSKIVLDQKYTEDNTAPAVLDPSKIIDAKFVVHSLTAALGADHNIQFPTAENLCFEITPGDAFDYRVNLGYRYRLRIINASAGAFTYTVTANTGITLNGTMTIPQNTWREFIVEITSDQPSAQAVSVQSVGSGTI